MTASERGSSVVSTGSPLVRRSGLLPVRLRPGGMFDGLDPNAFLISAETRCPLSQNCCTRVSQSRPRVFVSGDRMSVRSTGSQTTKREIGRLVFDKTSWSAEAPCTQRGQVGERKATTRVRLFAALKASLNEKRRSDDNETSRGCPGGVFPGDRR